MKNKKQKRGGARVDKARVDPVRGIINELGLSDREFAAAVGISERYVPILCGGGVRALPTPLIALVEKYLGPERAAKLEGDYAAFRRDLSDEARRKIEEKITVPGAGYIHPGLLG